MNKLSIKEMVEHIQQLRPFSAVALDHSFSITINEYLPYVCFAIHNGSNFREELHEKCRLDKLARWYEEDPNTGLFIASLPITIISHDSRYEYDLNRNPENCIYEEAWGRPVWKKPLTEEERETSLQKHTNFYTIVRTLIKTLEQLFDACLVYDVHSYNYQREPVKKNAPLFNIGTERIKADKYRKYIDHWKEELGQIQIDNVEVRAAENDVFFGRGYLVEFIGKYCKKTLVLATEIKKVYCNEKTGDDFPEVIDSLREGFKSAIISNAELFINERTNFSVKHKYFLLRSNVDTQVYDIDKALFKLSNGLETLKYVNPLNIEAEKKRFLTARHKFIPQFKYIPLTIDAKLFKRQLYQLPVNKIPDISLKRLYEDLIENQVQKIDLLSSRETRQFLYNSLKLHGEPTAKDIENAKYLLHLSNIKDESETVSDEEAVEILKDAVEPYGFKCYVELTKNLSAKAMVYNSIKTLKVRKGEVFTRNEVEALGHHEIGTHMVTTMNARSQPLHFLSLGLPRNTETQEGLAIYSEYLCGKLSTNRLKELGLRVLTVDMMLKGADFIEAYTQLHDYYGVPENKAFYLTTRIFRGGGFTKDYLYLHGLKKVMDYHQSGHDIKLLLLGKTSVQYHKILEELIKREILNAPTYISTVFTTERQENPVLDYLVGSLK